MTVRCSSITGRAGREYRRGSRPTASRSLRSSCRRATTSSRTASWSRRKTGADLAASIKDRRLFEQVERLRSAYAAVVLLVEGEPVHIGRASWQGALARALVAGAAVLQTRDPKESATWLGRLYRLEERGPSAARGLPRVRRPTDDLEAVAEDVLTCLPGISTVGAQRLLVHFGSLREVFAADEAELRSVAGIGPVRAAALARLFRTE